MGKVIILTGAPATGKSSLARALKDKISNLECVDYGQLLLDTKRAIIPDLTYKQLREQSSTLITPEDVANVDKELLKWVSAQRKKSHVLIDSHEVTKEFYGFRITPFKHTHIVELNPDAVISLYCIPEVVQDRIRAEPTGRPQVTREEALKHSQLQDGIAGLYSVLCGCPAYYLDSSAPMEQLCEIVIQVLHLQ